jgi:hypothetical protein
MLYTTDSGVQRTLQSGKLAALEEEVGLVATPATLSAKATTTVSLSEARNILEKMRIKLPAYINDAKLNSTLEALLTMNKSKTNTFVQYVMGLKQ